MTPIYKIVSEIGVHLPEKFGCQTH